MGAALYDVSPEQINHEWELVACAQTGDAGAFGHLYRLYRPIVMRTVESKLVGRRHVAQNLCGDTFLSAWRAIGTLKPRPGRSPVAWFVRIAGNKVKDFYLSGYNRIERPTSSEEIGGNSVELRGYMTPDQVAVTLAQRELAKDILDGLPPRYREALTRRYLDDQTLTEVQQAMGLTTPTAAKHILARARAAARIRVDPAGVELLQSA